MPSIKDINPVKTSGVQLKQDLGLENLQHVMIAKVIDFPVDIYLVYFNSRFPSAHLSISKIKKIDTFTLQRIKKSGFTFNFKNFKVTPPINLDDFTAKISNRSVVIRIDITGEYFANKNLYESFEKDGITII